MLKTLTVWNFALLEHVQVEFDRGLNILTGETGAGKSILIDSLGAILGHRMTADYIRTGCEWLRVEAVFDMEQQKDIHDFLLDQVIDDADENLIITRQITRAGKNMILINGCHVTLAVLKKLGEFLIDVHGQHENQALLRTENQFALLDGFEKAIGGQRAIYQKIYREWQACEAALKEKEDAAREYAQRLDMLRWQTNEIEAAQLKEKEDETLEGEIKILSNAEKIADFVKEAFIALDGGGGKNQQGALSLLTSVKQNLEGLSRYDHSLNNTLQMITDACCQLQEAAYEIRDYSENIDYSPQKLDKLQQRMDVIYKLCKKYGATTKDVMDHYAKAKQELADIENYDETIEQLRKEIDAMAKQVRAEADKLTALRLSAAGKLSKDIEQHLLSLGMPNAKFNIKLTPLLKFTVSGADDIVMMFSANLGETEKPIQKVASGGELSRIALAIKAVTAARDRIGVMVFDEIDTGIGGRTAQMVAEHISLVAVYKQVLCITHLPQIACMADVHLYIDKQVHGGKTVTEVKRLSKGEQLNEIARMASGVDATVASLDNAMEMVDNAKLKKEKQYNNNIRNDKSYTDMT